MAKFFDLDLTKLNAPLAKCEIPHKKGELVLADVGTAISWAISGDLSGYCNNRGTGTISKKTAKSTRNGVNPDTIGELTIGMHDGDLMSNDWNSRLYGILQRYIAGELTSKEIKIPIAVRVQRDFLSGYRGLNDGDPHRTCNKIENPDLIYGSMWQKITTPLSQSCREMVGRKKWTIISSILYSIVKIGVESEGWEWPEIYQNRSLAMRLANNISGDGLSLSDAQLGEMSLAIQYWYELLLTLKGEAGELNTKKILSSAGFFGFVVSMRLSPKNLMPLSHETTAKRILQNYNDIIVICPELCRGDHKTVRKFCTDLKQILKLKPHLTSQSAA